MDISEKLFGSAAKVKIIKLFLFNPESVFDINEVSVRAKVTRGLARREVLNLLKLGLIKPKNYSKEVNVQKNRKMVSVKKKASGYIINYKFEHLEQVYNFLSGSNVLKPEDIVAKISKAVKLDLLIIAGFFIKEDDSRVDMLVVGEHIKEAVLANIIKDLEANIGREITYAVFTTTEFKYRMSVFDKLVRDILDYKHEKLVNKINL